MKNKLIWICLIISSSFLFFYIGQYLIDRIQNMIIKGTIIPFYKYQPTIEKDFDEIKNNVFSFFKGFSFENIKSFFLKIFNLNNLILLVYVIQFVFILKLLFKLWVLGSDKKYKESKLAIGIQKTILFLKKYILEGFDFFKTNKKKIICVFLITSNLALWIVFETILFIVDYFISLINFSSHLMLLSIIKWCVVNLIHFILFGNKIVVVIVFTFVYWIIAEKMAFKKCLRNWACFKRLIRESATVNALDGEPSAGKTLTLSQASLAATENFIDEYERAMTEFEIQYPSFNFAKVRLLMKIFYLDFKEDELKNVISSAPRICFDLFKLYDFINTDVSRVIFNEYYRGTCIVGLMPINDPYFNTYCRLGSVSSMRFYQKMNAFPYEPDMTIIFPEYDKEFNSHDSTKEVGEDGTFAFFALISHLLERHGSVWLDCQDKDQGIKRIRAVAGGYYHLEKRKVCMPISIKILYKPLIWTYNRLLKLILAYLGYRPKTEEKWTSRKKQVVYKRNNLGAIYQILKYVGFVLNSLVGYLERFQYFKIYAEYATNDEFRNSKQIHYSLNVMDFDHDGNKIYNSTPFKKFYDDMKITLYKEKGLKQNLLMLEKWTSLEPSILEYAKTGLRNYSKIVMAQFLESEDK